MRRKCGKNWWRQNNRWLRNIGRHCLHFHPHQLTALGEETPRTLLVINVIISLFCSLRWRVCVEGRIWRKQPGQAYVDLILKERTGHQQGRLRAWIYLQHFEGQLLSTSWFYWSLLASAKQHRPRAVQQRGTNWGSCACTQASCAQREPVTPKNKQVFLCRSPLVSWSLW